MTEPRVAYEMPDMEVALPLLGLLGRTLFNRRRFSGGSSRECVGFVVFSNARIVDVFATIAEEVLMVSLLHSPFACLQNGRWNILAENLLFEFVMQIIEVGRSADT